MRYKRNKGGPQSLDLPLSGVTSGNTPPPLALSFKNDWNWTLKQCFWGFVSISICKVGHFCISVMGRYHQSVIL